MMSQYEKHVMECGNPETTCEDITVAVPVTVRAHAEIGEVKLDCQTKCAKKGDYDKPCNHNSVSKFIIVQKMRLCIPVKCVIECDIGDDCCDFDILGTECGGGGGMIVEQ